MRILLAAFALIVLASGCAAGRTDLSPVENLSAEKHSPIVIAERGKGAVPIVITTDKKLQTGAFNITVKEVSDCIFEISGERPKIIYGNIPEGPAIVVGTCPGVSAQDFPPDGFIVKSIGNKIYITGNDSLPKAMFGGQSEGSRYGLIDFAERILDVRWYFLIKEGGRSVEKKDKIEVSPICYKDYPRFGIRQHWPSHYDLALTYVLRHGASLPTMEGHVPRWKAEYAQSRPEIYQMKSDGTRETGGLGFLCYTNPETLKTYMERIDEEMKGGRKSTLMSENIVGVSPDDAEISCKCESCRKLWDEQAGQYGSATRIFNQFVSNLDKELAKSQPDLRVGLLAYLNYTQAPKDVRYNGRVNVSVCSMPGMAMWKEPSINAAEQKNLDEWFVVAGAPVMSYQYSCWPEDRTTAPFQYPHTVQEFYKKNVGKISGSFVNGTKDHWSRQNITLYVWYKALWNPDLDVDFVLDEFCRRMFGKAEKPMRELLRIQCDGWEKSRWENAALTIKSIHEVSYPRATVLKMKELVKEARELAAGDETVLKRINFYTADFANFFEESDRYASGNLIRPLLSLKVGEEPKLSGTLDDAVWERAEKLDFVRAYDRKESKPVYPSEIRSVWTAKGVYFRVKMTEPHPELLFSKNGGRDTSAAWHNDNIEMLLLPSGRNDGDFYHFIFDAGGGVYDAHKSDISWNNKGVKTAMAKGKTDWTIVVFVPWTEFPMNVPGSGTNTKWHGQFTRLRYDSPDKKAVDPASKGEYIRMNTTYAAFSSNLGDLAEIKFIEVSK